MMQQQVLHARKQQPCCLIGRVALPRLRVPATSVRPSRRQLRTCARALPKWPDMYKLLSEKQLRSVPPAEATQLAASGYALVDVRPPADHKASHPAGSVNVPMYTPIAMEASKLLKILMFRANGVAPVEPNPSYDEQLRAAAQGKKGVLLACEAGGTMRPTTSFPLGKPSRSLQAAFLALDRGLLPAGAQVLHVDSGCAGLFRSGVEFEGEGEYRPQLGRTPQAASDAVLPPDVQQRVDQRQREQQEQERREG